MQQAASLSDAACFMVLVVSVLIDMCRLFPDWLGDRLAFIGYLAAVAVGFKNSGLFENIRSFIDTVAAAPRGILDVPLTRGMAQVGPQVLALVVLLVTIGAMWPNRHASGSNTPMKAPPGAMLASVRSTASGIMGSLSSIEFSHFRQRHDFRAIFRAAFPGTVNLGMVGLAVLFIACASMAGTGLAGIMNSAIEHDVNLAATLIHPLMGRVA